MVLGVGSNSNKLAWVQLGFTSLFSFVGFSLLNTRNPYGGWDGLNWWGVGGEMSWWEVGVGWWKVWGGWVGQCEVGWWMVWGEGYGVG